VELLNLGVEIDDDWYGVGNTGYDLFHVVTLRFKDFICMVNFFWVVCQSITVLGNRYKII
jgi:hypothetical protein